jgi:hypothetical protein
LVRVCSVLVLPCVPVSVELEPDCAPTDPDVPVWEFPVALPAVPCAKQKPDRALAITNAKTFFMLNSPRFLPEVAGS